ncbi:DUF2087 domain-containing protein [Micromonospora sp. NPDC001898]|uniref:DUF2087 domain-containing protein n=1 Tax=Micromonospora sp. NPDC001898 TaxID=3364221 RepID=UPI003688BBDE
MPTVDPELPAGSDEHPASCGDIVGLLAEPARRAAFAALVLGARTVGSVAEQAGLTRKAAASALRKLVDGGIAAEDRTTHSYAPVEDAFRRAVQAEIRVGGRSGGHGAGAYFRRGRITAVPGDAEIRSRVLAVVVDTFTPGEVYPEARVNALCGEWFDDWVTLRRALVDEGLLKRNHAGTAYERA